jgi:chromate transport protein ChrA
LKTGDGGHTERRHQPQPSPADPGADDHGHAALAAYRGHRFRRPTGHIALLRRLRVSDKKCISDGEFEDGIAATSLLPGPASTQLAIYCAWRLRGTVGAVLGGICFIVPGLVIILALAVLLLSGQPARPVLGAAAGAGAAVAAVALQAAARLVPASWQRAGTRRSARIGICHRWLMAAASRIAEPAMAPIAAGPAPARKARTVVLAWSWSKCWAPARTNTMDGA